MTDPVVRHAHPDDAEALTALQHDCFAPGLHEPLEAMAAEIERGTVLVADEGGELVGAVSVRAQDEGATWYLGLLMVRPDRRGRGHWRRLMAAGEGLAPASVLTYRLRIGADRDDNRRLYESMGYAVVDDPSAASGVLVMTRSRPVR